VLVAEGGSCPTICTLRDQVRREARNTLSAPDRDEAERDDESLRARLARFGFAFHRCAYQQTVTSPIRARIWRALSPTVGRQILAQIVRQYARGTAAGLGAAGIPGMGQSAVRRSRSLWMQKGAFRNNPSVNWRCKTF
jgi:hypothetical protein